MTGNDRTQGMPGTVDTPVRSRLLAVGDLFPPDLVDPSGAGSEISYMTFDEVTPTALARLRPDVVLSPLVSPVFDCFDLAEKLAGVRFAGRYRAVAPSVPNPALVRREIADRFPGLDFDLLLMNPQG